MTDPTQLTTQQLDRALIALRELLEARIDGMDKAVQLMQVIVDKLPGQTDEKVSAVKELHEERFRATTEVRHQLDIRTQQQFADRDLRSTEHEDRNASARLQLEKSFEQQFAAVQQQFAERDERANQTEQNARTAVDAALQAAKEAVQAQNNSSALAIAKSEAATDKRIENLGNLMTNSHGALDGKIGDLKDRLSRVETALVTAATSRTGMQQSAGTVIGMVVGVIGVLLAIGSVVVAVAMRAGGGGG